MTVATLTGSQLLLNHIYYTRGFRVSGISISNLEKNQVSGKYPIQNPSDRVRVFIFGYFPGSGMDKNSGLDLQCHIRSDPFDIPARSHHATSRPYHPHLGPLRVHPRTPQPFSFSLIPLVCILLFTIVICIGVEQRPLPLSISLYTHTHKELRPKSVYSCVVSICIYEKHELGKKSSACYL